MKNSEFYAAFEKSGFKHVGEFFCTLCSVDDDELRNCTDERRAISRIVDKHLEMFKTFEIPSE